jgi:hypothetical protein
VIETCIHSIRGCRVMLSGDLAQLYRVEARALVQAVRRNRRRFPADFMFRLTRAEWANLKSQTVISSWGGVRALPYAFTEQGVAMLSSVLRSTRAVAVNVEIMRTFVRLRGAQTSLTNLARKLDELERRFDSQFGEVFQAIRDLVTPAMREPRRIGFKTESRARLARSRR